MNLVHYLFTDMHKYVRNVRFPENLAFFLFFYNRRFEICFFCPGTDVLVLADN